MGSFRRKKPESGDIDLLISNPKNKNSLSEIVSVLSQKNILTDNIGLGKVYYKGVYKNDEGKGRRIDIRFINNEEWIPAIMHSTGSGSFNERIRLEAKKKGYKLSEHGLFRGEKLIPTETEKDIFDELEMEYLSPENRN